MIGTNLAITPKSYFRGLSLDPDAQIYISAANITDTTQQSAVNQLVLDFKSIGVWTKEKALYPVLGGSASSHAVNLKQPGTFNLTFTNGWTHSSTGMKPLNAYADTKLAPSIFLSLNSTHISVYSRTDSDSITIIGTNSGSPSYQRQLQMRLKNSNLTYNSVNQDSASTLANSDSRGFFLSKRTASTGIVMQKNSVLTSKTQASSVLSTFNIYLGCSNNGGIADFYANQEIAFSSIGDGLTDTEAVNKTVAVQKYQRALGRAVDMEIQVGTGATRSYYTPFSTMDNYSISGNIYLQSEVIGAAIPILGIEMYFSGFTLPYTMANQEIYLAHVTQSQFDSAPAVDFSDLTLSDLTLVKASFTFTAANNSWVRMNFDTPFQYNGTSNILVIWKNNKGTWTSGGGGTDTHVSTSRSMYKVGSTGQPTGNGTLTNSRSNIKFIW